VVRIAPEEQDLDLDVKKQRMQCELVASDEMSAWKSTRSLIGLAYYPKEHIYVIDTAELANNSQNLLPRTADRYITFKPQGSKNR
jgi:hypothetical protein